MDYPAYVTRIMYIGSLCCALLVCCIELSSKKGGKKKRSKHRVQSVEHSRLLFRHRGEERVCSAK